MCPIFDSSPPVFGARYQRFLRVCWYLPVGVTNFVYPSEKFNSLTDANVQLWPFTVLVPVEVEVHAVPHLKAPVNAKVQLWRLACGGTFTVQTSLLKIDCLVHKLGFDISLLNKRKEWSMVTVTVNGRSLERSRVYLRAVYEKARKKQYE